MPVRVAGINTGPEGSIQVQDKACLDPDAETPEGHPGSIAATRNAASKTRGPGLLPGPFLMSGAYVRPAREIVERPDVRQIRELDVRPGRQLIERTD